MLPVKRRFDAGEKSFVAGALRKERTAGGGVGRHIEGEQAQERAPGGA